MGVAHDPNRGVSHIDYSCGAKVGYHVTAYGQSYEVVEIDNWGCYVCRNLNEDCLVSDELRVFDDLDN